MCPKGHKRKRPGLDEWECIPADKKKCMIGNINALRSHGNMRRK